MLVRQEARTCGDKACHPEPIRCAQGKLREGAGSPDAEILRCAQDDSRRHRQPVNLCRKAGYLILRCVVISYIIICTPLRYNLVGHFGINNCYT
jgi:hypothetical protein